MDMGCEAGSGVGTKHQTHEVTGEAPEVARISREFIPNDKLLEVFSLAQNLGSFWGDPPASSAAVNEPARPLDQRNGLKSA